MGPSKTAKKLDSFEFLACVYNFYTIPRNELHLKFLNIFQFRILGYSIFFFSAHQFFKKKISQCHQNNIIRRVKELIISQSSSLAHTLLWFFFFSSKTF